MGSYLFFLLILACPLVMFFMMRGMMGGGQSSKADGSQMQTGHGPTDTGMSSSVQELRREREQLDREIEKREADEQSSSPVGTSWR